MTPAEHLAATPDPLAEIALRRQLCSEAWLAGYEAALADVRREADLRFARQPIQKAKMHITLVELEQARWGPGGREHFAEPRPGDRPGGREAA